MEVTMQNPNVKYVKTATGNLFVFYLENGAIFCQQYTQNNFSPPLMIAEKIIGMFSVCQYSNTTYVLYCQTDGKLHMSVSKDHTHWDETVVMENPQNSGKGKIFLLPTETSFHMIYHLPTASTGIDSLLYTQYENSSWGKPYQIDRFMPYGKNPFFARRLSNDHIILYYRTSRNIWSAREMLLSPYTMGSLTPMIQTHSPYIDISIVNSKERIHILYCIRTMFRTQVVYQYKQTSIISTPRVIWDDVNCDQCIAHIEKDSLILMWTANNIPMRCISKDQGATFGIAEKFTDKFPARCIKCELIGADDVAFNATEIFIDGANAYQPFLPIHTPIDLSGISVPSQPQINYNKVIADQNKNHKNQLDELSTLLAQRSDEIAMVNARWQGQVSALEKQVFQLREEREQLNARLNSVAEQTIPQEYSSSE